MLLAHFLCAKLQSDPIKRYQVRDAHDRTVAVEMPEKDRLKQISMKSYSNLAFVCFSPFFVFSFCMFCFALILF